MIKAMCLVKNQEQADRFMEVVLKSPNFQG